MNATADTPAPAGTSRGKRHRILLIIAAVFILIGLIGAALWYFVFSLRQVTSDAYVHGNMVTVAAQLAAQRSSALALQAQALSADIALTKALGGGYRTDAPPLPAPAAAASVPTPGKDPTP